MPGIGGFILPAEKNPAQKNKALLKSMQWDAAYRSLSFFDEQAGLALNAVSNYVVGFGKIFLEKRYHCFFYGELYPAELNKSRLAWLANVKLFLRNFINQGTNFLARADGTFLIAVWDSKERSLTIANDIFGSYPLNYFYNNKQFIFSSQLFAIKNLLYEKRTDETGLAELLTLGMTLNGRTYLKNVRRLLPAEILYFSEGSLTNEIYYRPFYRVRQDRPLKYRLETISQAFEQSVEKRVVKSEKSAAALSGGFDTRAMWSVFLSKKLSLTAITRGVKNSADMKIARQIANSLNIPQRQYLLEDISLRNFAVWAEQLILMSEGFMNVGSALLIPYYQDLSASFDVLIDGSGGALLRRQSAWRYELPGNKQKDLPSFTYNLYRKKLSSDGTLKPDFRNSFEDLILADLSAYYERIAGFGEAGDLLDLFYLQQICALRTSADLLFQSHFLNCRQPFYDRVTFELARSFSIAQRRKLYIHQNFIRRNFPALENFPLESGDYIIPYQGFRYKRFLPLFINQAVPKLSFLHFKKYPLQNPQKYFQEGLNKYLKEILLDSQNNSSPYWDKAKIEQMIKEHEQGQADYSEHFFQLLTMELFLRRLNIAE